MCILTLAGGCCALEVVFERGYCGTKFGSEDTPVKHGREENRLKTAYPFHLVFSYIYSLTLDLCRVGGLDHLVSRLN